MWAKATRWVKIIMLIMPLLRAEDSLQSALNAVNRRQRDLSEYRRFGDYDNEGYSKYGFLNDDNDNLAFLTPENYNIDGKMEEKNIDLERALIDYLEEKGMLDLERGNSNDRISSSFRERVEKDKAKQKEKMAEMFLNKFYTERGDDNGDYTEFQPKSYDKYHKSYPDNYDDSNIYQTKRSYYNNLGWNSIGMKKRSRYFQPDGPSDSLYLLNYAPRDEIFNRLEEEESNLDPEYNWNKYPREQKSSRLAYPYIKKRFPVTKRSSNYFPVPYQAEFTHQHKRSPKKDLAKTDPKVEKDLTNIFNPKPKSETNQKTDKTKKPTLTTQKPKREDKKHEVTKEEIPTNVQSEKPLEIKKKSVNWSDYFGLDRRKKSGDDIDDEWLMERYHKAVTLATKRSANYPLQNFHNHDQVKKETKIIGIKNKSDASKIKDMDEKLKNIEESIVDDALKFTGAHEGVVDSKEIQEVKDRIISRLAAAYSLEKMRRALGEYKQSLEKESNEKNHMKPNKNDDISEEKRVSVPRKQAIDEDRNKHVEEDNNIKCTQGDECEEQNYKIPSEILEQTNYNKGEGCPKIEQACNEVSSILGPYGQIFETACNMHQMCLLCGDNSWFSPTRQCNVLFLSKADELCDGDEECQRVARQSVKYLLRVNRSLRADPYGACDLECPDKR